MGKIILDIYGDPDALGDVGCDIVDTRVMIDGGGPQAAWGACASVTAQDELKRKRRGEAIEEQAEHVGYPQRDLEIPLL